MCIRDRPSWSRSRSARTWSVPSVVSTAHSGIGAVLGAEPQPRGSGGDPGGERRRNPLLSHGGLLGPTFPLRERDALGPAGQQLVQALVALPDAGLHAAGDEGIAVGERVHQRGRRQPGPPPAEILQAQLLPVSYTHLTL